jgi:two-component system chemotaxis response regulator CheY
MPFGFIPDSAFGFAGIPIMMTGYSDKVRVEEARDVGVTEFLAKPFTAQDLYARIEKLIEKPRRFVEAEAFFGPERRRRKMKAEEYKGPKRRDAEPAGEPGPQRRDDEQIAGAGVICAATETHCRDCV